MKHLLVTNDFPPKIGGIQSLLWEWWRRLPSDSFAVLTSPYEGAAEFDASLPFHIERTKEPVLLPHPGMVRRVNRMAAEVGADLVVLDPALPLGLIGIGLGTILLPVVSRQLSEGKEAEAMETQNRGLELALFLESDRMGFLLDTMSPERVDSQRDVVKNERRQSFDNRPYGQASIELDKMLWPANHPYSWPTIGYMEDLTAAGYDDVVGFFKKYYVPNNSVLIITGDVSPAAAFALADRIFSPWKRGDDPFANAPVPPIPPLTKSEGVIVEEDVNAVSVVIQWHGPSVRKDEEATFVADVYSDVLNNQQSRFQKKLVDSGLWQGVVVNYYTLNNVGPISVSGQTSPEKLRTAMAGHAPDADVVVMAAAVADFRPTEVAGAKMKKGSGSEPTAVALTRASTTSTSPRSTPVADAMAEGVRDRAGAGLHPDTPRNLGSDLHRRRSLDAVAAAARRDHG